MEPSTIKSNNINNNNRLMVYVRVKPQLDSDGKSVIDIVDNESLVFDPIDSENEPTDEYFYHGKKFKSIGARKNKNSSYSFDRVFDPFSTNYNIYETVTRPMVDATINGLNCSVFAYGATGSGKTFTMLGSPNYPGVIYYTARDLFGKLQNISRTDPLPADLKICYFEIYNEKIRDLLVWEPNNFIRCGNKRLRTTPERCRARQQLLQRDTFNLPVCEGSGDGNSLVIPDLTYHTPSNAEQLIDLLEAGNRNRSQHPTDANADSSRSHAIFQIVLTRRTRRLNVSSIGAEYELQSSKMSLIDLAGSERASVAYRAGNDRSKNLQREGGNINKSLLALGNCINALADPKQSHKYIPYRNSKLTRLLRDSLGGKCRTAMIATVCQSHRHYDDTQNTLVYASRAKCIKLRPGRNFTDVAIQPKNYNLIIDNQNKQIVSLQSQNDQLKIELEDIKNELATLRANPPNKTLHQVPFNLSQTFIAREKANFLESSCHRRQLDELFDERREIRMEILKYESKFRKNELKLVFKKMDEARQQVVTGDVPKMNGNSTFILATEPVKSYLSSEQSQAIQTQLDFFDQERKTLLERSQSNEVHIRDVISNMTTEFEMKGHGTNEDFDTEIGPYINEKELSQELEEKIFSEQHAYDVAQEGMNRLLTTENLLVEASHVVRYTHAVTKGRCLSDALESKLSQLFRKLEGKKNVVWKDDKYATENNPSDKSTIQLTSVHDNFSLNFLTPFKNNNTLMSRRLSKNLVSFNSYTPEQTNTTFDASQ